MGTATILVRTATARDAEEIVEFNLALAAESEGRTLRREVVSRGVARVLADPTLGTYFVAEIEGRVVGQLLITREFSDWRNGHFWWIQSVYTRPEARQRGVYRALHEHVERAARAAGDVCGLRLYVDRGNVGAQRTYARLGLKATAYDFYEVDWSTSWCGR